MITTLDAPKETLRRLSRGSSTSVDLPEVICLDFNDRFGATFGTEAEDADPRFITGF
jgi:hypothetical protein